MVAAPFRFLSLLREHQPEKGFFKWFAVSACNRNTLPGFHEDFGRVEMVYVRKVDKITAVTFEKAIFFHKLIFHNMKWGDGRDDLPCPQIKKNFFILGFGKFDVMKIHPLVALCCFQNQFSAGWCSIPIVKGKQLCCDTAFRSPLSDQICCIL